MLHNVQNKALVGLAFVAGVLGLAGTAHAGVIEDAFAANQTTLVAQAGLAVAMIIAVLAVGVGIRLLIKATKRAASAL